VCFAAGGNDTGHHDGVDQTRDVVTAVRSKAVGAMAKETSILMIHSASSRASSRIDEAFERWRAEVDRGPEGHPEAIEGQERSNTSGSWASR